MDFDAVALKENAPTANPAVVTADGGAKIPATTVVLVEEKDQNGNLVSTENGILYRLNGKYFLQNLQPGTRYILKTDAHIDYGTFTTRLTMLWNST